MPEYKLSLTLLSLFTGTDRALEIQGDLLEESREHGRVWFYTHVWLTTFALYGRAFMQAPLKTMVVSVVLGDLLFLIFWFEAYYINQPYHRFPEFLQWLGFGTGYFFFLFMPAISYLSGVILVKVANRIGVKILVTSLLVFVLLVASIFVYSLLTVPTATNKVEVIGFFLTGIAYILGLIAFPMIVGAIQALRRRENKQARLA